jgi:hypothetical protein
MRNLKGLKSGLLLPVAVLVCLLPRVAYTVTAVTSGGATVETTSTQSSTVISKQETERLGLGVFSDLPFHVSVSARGGYDDNIFTSNDVKKESWFMNLGGAITYDFGDPRTQLSLGIGGGATYYFDRPNENDFDPNIYLNLSLTHKATPRLTFAAQAYATYQAEPDFSLVLGLNRRSGNFFYTLDKFTVTYLWAPRFATATSYTLGMIRYDDSSIGFFEDRFENTVGNEFRFLLWPTTTLVGEYRFQIISYDDIMRDSGTHFGLAGFDHSFSPRLNASFRGGAEYRDYCDNEQGTDRVRPYFEGTVNYALGKETTVSWTNRYGIEESDVSLNASRTTYRTGLRAKHNFTPRISGALGVYYQHDQYDSIDSPMVVALGFDEDSFDAAVSVRYAITRIFGVEAGYNHTEVISDSSSREYKRNRVFAGLNLAF